VKFRPLEKRIKDDLHQSSRVLLFLPQRIEEILEVLKLEPVDEKLRRNKSM
jgi:hypothetical protein